MTTKRLSGQAIRTRMEMLAPDAIDQLEKIWERLAGDLDPYQDSEGNFVEPSWKRKVAIAKELRMVAREVLDRGGVPALKQVQMESHVHTYERLSETELLKAIAEKMEALEPGERQLLLKMQPGLLAALPDGEQ